MKWEMGGKRGKEKNRIHSGPLQGKQTMIVKVRDNGGTMKCQPSSKVMSLVKFEFPQPTIATCSPDTQYRQTGSHPREPCGNL